MLKDQILNLAKELHPELIEIRNEIHSNPELSFCEFETQKKVENYLQNRLGLVTQRMANTGVVALIEGKNPSRRVVGMRADMDALPIVEVNDGRSYRSKTEGVMHACGHDVHTTSLLGAATIINKFKNQFEGTIKLIFQPGEEKLPGGASLLIKDGVLENPKVDYMIGQHVMPLFEAGKVGFKKGLYMASTDEIFITVKGKGGHGALPNTAIDSVLMASHLVVALQQIVSRNATPSIPTVLSFGKIIGNGATNVLPPEVKLEGTFRTVDEVWRDKAHNRIHEICKSVGEMFGGEIDCQINKGYPFLKNHEGLTQNLINNSTEYLGAENIIDLDIWMAAEDFSYYSQEVPSTFYRLGIRNEERGIVNSVHHPAFDIDEDALLTGAGLFAYLGIKALEGDIF